MPWASTRATRTILLSPSLISVNRLSLNLRIPTLSMISRGEQLEVEKHPMATTSSTGKGKKN